MNRRDFTKSLAALGLAPALPGLPAAAASARAAAPFTPYMYGLGAHLARSTGGSSAAILAKKLSLAPQAAHAMQAQLLRQGIVTAPNAAGLAIASEPYMQGARLMRAAIGSGTDGLKSTARKWLDAQIEDQSDEDEQDDIPPQSTSDDTSKTQP
ncbi:MAG: hypothetical protein AB8B82_10540 [Roseovarius sp.]